MDTGTVTVTSPREGLALVEFAGEHDLTEKDAVATLLDQQLTEHEVVVVDLCSATFIDSSFISCLLIAHRNAHQQGRELRVYVCDSPNVDAVLKVTGIDEHLAVYSTREEALA